MREADIELYKFSIKAIAPWLFALKWEAFLTVNKNKEELFSYLSDQLTTTDASEGEGCQNKVKVLYLTKKDKSLAS